MMFDSTLMLPESSPLLVYSRILTKYADDLGKFFEKNIIEEGHGATHAYTVASHAMLALNSLKKRPDTHQSRAVILAALLHDVDDHKLFNTIDYANARKILAQETPEIVDLVIKMISLVSCSANGNNIDPALPEWMYYPRWADRLEAIGEEGIRRCHSYSVHVGRPLFTEETPRVTNMEDLAVVAPPSRFSNYIETGGKVGLSTMIDHFYDKLVHLRADTNNPYFNNKFEEGMAPIYKFLFDFGRTDTIGEIN